MSFGKLTRRTQHIASRTALVVLIPSLVALLQCGGGDEPGTRPVAGGKGGSGGSSVSAGKGFAGGSSFESGNPPGAVASGTGGDSGFSRPAEPCGPNGTRVCAGAEQKQRLVCVNGTLESDTPCAADENCDRATGQCLPIAAGCANRVSGYRFCDAAGNANVCGADLVHVETTPCDGACSAGRCAALGCGDGVTTPPEECDDGNMSDTDSCTSRCTKATCGDGVKQLDEDCDDGNTIDEDSCTGDCEKARCGDGFTQPGEVCDDGNTIDDDDCTNDCKEPKCGDDIVQTGELCDDGNRIDNDDCTNDCKEPKCGDDIVQMGEACDDGNTVNDDGCTNECKVRGCPDNVKQTGEDCDDGNMSNDDDCTNACRTPKCGDSFIQPAKGEVCDDGNSVNDDGCSNDCKEAKCGDNIKQPGNGETCDDGNTNDNDGCSSTCKTETCGDNVKQNNEQCDDGNTANEDTCTANCQKARCGDGFPQPTNPDGAEDCDDANQNNFDGCTNKCKRPQPLSKFHGQCTNEAQSTRTVCISAITQFCNQFGGFQMGLAMSPVDSSTVNVGCLNGLTINTGLSWSDKFQSSCAQQQSPSCLSRVTAECRNINQAFEFGFISQPNIQDNKATVACGDADLLDTTLGELKNKNGKCTDIADASQLALECTKAIGALCQEKKGKNFGLVTKKTGDSIQLACMNLQPTTTAKYN